MDPSLKHQKKQSIPTSSTPETTQEVEPFENPNAMTNPDRIRARELEIIAENPDVLGLNIESSLIADPSKRNLSLWAKNILDSGGELSEITQTIQSQLRQNGVPESKIASLTNDSIKAAMDYELSKDQRLDDTLAKLPVGAKFRVNPHAPLSPFSLAQSLQADSEGRSSIHLDNHAIEQIRKIKDKTQNSELTVVISQIHPDENGALTSDIPSDATDYIALCQEFVRQSGYAAEGGRGLVLELGNECNMCHQHGGAFDSDAFPSHSDPATYADFYYDIAVALKTSFPELKLSLTGTAFYDPSFIQQVVDRVQSRKTQEDVDLPLIDVISFHPYRNTVESPTTLVEGNHFGDNSNQTFEDQLSVLKIIAEPLGAEVTVGEVSFYQNQFGESIDENEMVKNAIRSRDSAKGAYFSYLWPGDQIVQ